MPVKLSHIAFAAPDLNAAIERIGVLGLALESVHEVESEKVKVAMVPVEISPHFRLEYLEPLDPNSSISKFLLKRPDGGIHHICFEVERLEDWEKKLQNEGITILPPGIRKAARGRALFVHPKNMGGILVELEEIKK